MLVSKLTVFSARNKIRSHQSMNKKKMYILILLVSVVSLGLLVRAYFRSERYFLSSLPEKYKNYPALNESIKSEKYQIIPLFIGTRPREIFRDSVQNNFIVESVEEFKAKEYEQSTYSITFYRINSKGEALDSLNEAGNTAFGRPFNGHLLYEDSYSDYLITGKHQKQPYKIINKDLSMATNTLADLTSDLLAQADAVTIYEENDPMIFIMSVKGEVLKVYVPKNSKITVPAEFEDNFHRLLPATDYSYATGFKHYDWENPKSAITLDYFLKQHYKSGTYFSMAAAPVNKPARWYGMGYFNLKIGTDVVKFKHPISYLLSGSVKSGGYYYNDEWGTLDLFNQNMEYFNILTVGYDNNHAHQLDGCYLIVPLHAKQ
jgi:hypothetical protein